MSVPSTTPVEHTCHASTGVPAKVDSIGTSFGGGGWGTGRHRSREGKWEGEGEGAAESTGEEGWEGMREIKKVTALKAGSNLQRKHKRKQKQIQL